MLSSLVTMQLYEVRCSCGRLLGKINDSYEIKCSRSKHIISGDTQIQDGDTQIQDGKIPVKEIENGSGTATRLKR